MEEGKRLLRKVVSEPVNNLFRAFHTRLAACGGLFWKANSECRGILEDASIGVPAVSRTCP